MSKVKNGFKGESFCFYMLRLRIRARKIIHFLDAVPNHSSGYDQFANIFTSEQETRKAIEEAESANWIILTSEGRYRLTDTGHYEAHKSKGAAININFVTMVATVIMAIANVVLVSYILVQTYVQIAQLYGLNAEVKALQDQVTISRQEFESMTRPWVGIKEVHFQTINCVTEESFVQPLTREEMDNPNPVLGYLSANQYAFRNKCTGLDTTFDVTVRNYGSIPAKSIRIAYMITDNRAPDWNENDFTRFESMVSMMQNYKTIELMPQQETTIQLNQNVTLANFSFLDVVKMEEYAKQLDVQSRSGTFGAVPNLLLIGMQYEYGEGKSDTVGIVYKTSGTSELRIVNSWNPIFE